MSRLESNELNSVSINEDDELLALEELLSATDDNNEKGDSVSESMTPFVDGKTVPQLCEDNTFLEAFSYDLGEIQDAALKGNLKASQSVKELDHLDSSDDEEVKNFLERKYNEYGSDINKKLKQQREMKQEEAIIRDVDLMESNANGDTDSFKSNTTIFHIKNPHNPIKRRSLVSQSFKKAPPPTARNISTAQNELGSSDGRSLQCSLQPLNCPENGSTVFTDPVFGLRIINPLISSALLLERMAERKAIPFSAVAFHTQRGDLSKDWVIAGVLVHKYPIKLSKKGDPYSLWRLSDLKGDIKMISLFLFKQAHKELWKTSTGTSLAILNPTVFEKRADSGEVASLSIDTSQKVMVLGRSKDLGVCKAKKKNGEPCTAIVNVGECDYCVYHMKQEFSKMSVRSELQSANAGRGLNELRNKILGKSEVFYGGKSFSAVPAKRSTKQAAKDSSRLMSLSAYATSPNAGSINHAAKPKSCAIDGVPYAVRDGPVSKIAANVEASNKQRLKDIERLKILQAEQDVSKVDNAAEKPTVRGPKLIQEPPTVGRNALNCEIGNLGFTEKTALTLGDSSPLNKFKDRSFSFTLPKLSRESFHIEINIGERSTQAAKLNAVQLIKKKPLAKTNPNSLRGTKEGKRRAIDDLHERFDSPSKRNKIEDDQKEIERKSRIQRIIEATSSHTNLIDMREHQEQEKYFNKLEKKEALEEKMLNTYKIPCKAVICQQCKYTAFSAAERCKAEGHSLKVIDAEKRFFQCKDCGNRTATVFKLPKISCKNCSGSRWERAAMIRERKVYDGSENLSLRGDEETFIGSLGSKVNLNLLVPEE